MPTARGAYFSSYTGKQITELTRAGRTSQIEDLLIGTLFSQFGSRRTKLSGDMQILDHALSAYTEQNQEGKNLLLWLISKNVIMDISNVTITELRPDEYKKNIATMALQYTLNANNRKPRPRSKRLRDLGR